MRPPLPLLALVVAAAAACGPSTAALEAFDVTRSPSRDCTLTGATTRDCVDETLLAQQRVKGRWIIEHSAADSFTLTTEQGTTLAGIHFVDDGRVLNEAPCIAGGGRCYFARRRFESSDADNCTSFGELVYILRRADGVHLEGIVADVSGTDQDCGTSTVIERAESISGLRVDEPVVAREDAEGGTP